MNNFEYNIDDIVFPEVAEKTFSYSEIKNVDPTTGKQRKIYLWNPEMKEPLQGKGIQEMQRKMLYVLRYLAPYTFNKLYPKKEDIVHVTKGIYGPRTVKLVMSYQSIFMYREFKEKEFAISSGFGCFGGNTKDNLEKNYSEAMSENKNKKYSDSGNSSRNDEYIMYLIKNAKNQGLY